MNEKRKRENVLNFLKFQENVGLLYEIQSISQRQAVVVLTVSKGDVSGICPSSPSHIHTVTPTYISSDLEYQKPTDDRNDKREGANGAAEMESPETIDGRHHTALRSRDSFAFTARFNRR